MGSIIVLVIIWGFVFWLISNYGTEIWLAILNTIAGDPLVTEIIDFLW